jgi:hypothetical protein
MKKLIMMILLALTLVPSIHSQTSEDALRYSRIFYSGTARFMGMSGAYGAVGADFSSLAINPAGIGIYQSSELSMTIAPMISSSESDYYRYNSSDNKVNFAMGNLGFVFTIKPYGKNRSNILKNFNIGFGVNRQNDFNNNTYIQGLNPTSSMMQSYTNEMNSLEEPPNMVEIDYPFDYGLAYSTNLVNWDSAGGTYWCDATYGGVMQRKQINSWGSINEMDISFGGNIMDKLYFGMTIGVPFIRYYENSQYQESDIQDTIPIFNYMKYDYHLQTSGTGINLKIGFIYRPVDWFRFGVSVHTPTWYSNMRDEWYSSMESNFSESQWNATQYSPIGNFDYRLTTPFRAIGSLAFILGPYGLISADYEYVNYSQARFNSYDYNYQTINTEIKNSYQSWGNIRVGTEWRIQNFRLRGGFAYFSNPYKTGINNSERFQASGGIGYRGKIFFADMTYTWSQMKGNYYLYDASMVQPATNTLSTNTISTTVGIRF